MLVPESKENNRSLTDQWNEIPIYHRLMCIPAPAHLNQNPLL